MIFIKNVKFLRVSHEIVFLTPHKQCNHCLAKIGSNWEILSFTNSTLSKLKMITQFSLSQIRFSVTLAYFLRVCPYKWDSIQNQLILSTSRVHRFHYALIRLWFMSRQIFLLIRLRMVMLSPHPEVQDLLIISFCLLFCILFSVILCGFTIHEKIILEVVNKFLKHFLKSQELYFKPSYKKWMQTRHGIRLYNYYLYIFIHSF